MPTYFIINGEKREGFYSHDTLIRSDYRGKGIGPHLVKSQIESCDAIIAALWFNTANHRAYQKAGWTDIRGLTSLTRRLSFEDVLAARLGSGPSAKTLLFFLNRLIALRDLFIDNDNGKDDIFSLEYIDQFDEKIDDLIERISRNFRVIMPRKSTLLNWKYADHRNQGYSKFMIRNKNEFSGYMVLKVTGRSGLRYGTIVDFLAMPDNTGAFDTMLKEAIRFFKKKKVCSISILTTEPLFKDVLRKYGFNLNKQTMDFMIARWENTYPKDLITDIKNWYITFGDADYGMWTT